MTDIPAVGSGVGGVLGVAELRLYSAAFFARNEPQLEMVAFAAAPAVAPISVAAVAALAAEVADGAKDSGRKPFGGAG